MNNNFGDGASDVEGEVGTPGGSVTSQDTGIWSLNTPDSQDQKASVTIFQSKIIVEHLVLFIGEVHEYTITAFIIRK